VSRLDDELRSVLRATVQRPGDEDATFRTLARRRQWRATARTLGTGGTAVVVVAGMVGSLVLLGRGLQPGAPRQGVVAFVRVLRSCPGLPNVPGPDPEVFAVDLASGAEYGLQVHEHLTKERFRAERWPDFSPDGTRYVWVDQFQGDLYVTDVAGGDVTRLTQGLRVEHPEFSPDGSRIAFDAAPADPREGASSIYVIGAEGAGLQRLPGQGGFSPTWSPDGRSIAFASTDAAGETSFFEVDADGSDLREVYRAPADVAIYGGEWSPDGERFVGDAVVNSNRDVYVVDVADRSIERLTTDPASDREPSWSPDGSMIAFATGRWDTGPGAGGTEIAVMDSDGSNVRRVTDNCWDDEEPVWISNPASVLSQPTWSPPPPPELGKPHAAPSGSILYSATSHGVSDVYALDPATGESVRVTADLAEQLAPVWSPDHSQIAFAGDNEEPGNLDVYVMSADGTDLTRLTSTPEDEGRLAWSPDGREIGYQRSDGVWVMNAEGSHPHLVVPASGVGGFGVSWSPDGRRIAFAEGSDLFVTNADGTDLSRVTSGVVAFGPRWSPDGDRILFTCDRDICTVAPDGSDLVDLTRGTRDSYERDADWSPDGTRVVFGSARSDGTSGVYLMDADGSNVQLLGGEWAAEPDW
jgi:Tol biopolymer transport system component